MNPFTKIYRFSWVILLILIFFLDRDNLYWVIATILLLVVLSGIAVLRSLESRKEWRQYNKEESLNDNIHWLSLNIRLSWYMNLWVVYASKLNLKLIYAEKLHSFESSLLPLASFILSCFYILCLFQHFL